VLTSPMNSSMIFGLLPADSIRVGTAIRVGIWSENRSNADQAAQGLSRQPSAIRKCAFWGCLRHPGAPGGVRIIQENGLRDTFHDDLLIRTSTGYEPTPTGQRLLQDLATMLPRLERLMAGGDFDPVTEDASFRIAATDHGAYLLVPPLFTSVLPKGTKVNFSFVPLHAGQYEALEKGRLDLVLNADYDAATAHLSKEFF
jgi:hypothetical protein